ncbi:myosin-11 isoform X7 [Neocloeon triangulifer]|uniref:myosin-11 isoform X7 n=1 Tax=Neocloeon triangulifer TaxID=2078957 RepID=UPI00286F1254|nr:myosin-11 isoform X7 [Neocloeon triangulifer]
MHSSFIKTKGGDPLCPLGFHPQVRWPTRCKRCFRDYKEHGGNKKDDSSLLSSLRRDTVTASTPAISSWASQPFNRSRESGSSTGLGTSGYDSVRSPATSASSTDLSKSDNTADVSVTLPRKTAASWTSTPDLKSLDEDTTSVTIKMPPRVRIRAAAPEALKEEAKSTEKETDYRSAQYTFRRRTLDLTKADDKKSDLTTDTLAGAERPRLRRTLTQPIQEELPPTNLSGARKRTPALDHAEETSSKNKADLDLVTKVKSSSGASSTSANKTDLSILSVLGAKERENNISSSSSSDDESDDASSIACTDTTDTTVVDQSNDDEIAQELKRELDTWKVRCEKAEREKSDILLRRLGGTRETAPSSAEALKLQQRVNELQQLTEDLRDERKSLSLRVKELENENEAATAREPEMRRTIEDLRNKLSAAETLCEELMDENEEIKKEIRDLEEEIDEMQDNFREEQADEYTSLKKELEQTAKNCRILQFKLRKAERKAEALEAAKSEVEKQLGDKGGNLQSIEKIQQLEKDLKLQSEVSERLHKETENLKTQLAREKAKSLDSRKTTPIAESLKKKVPVLGKSASGEAITRASLTRGGSQDDPVQLLRDLQDAMEREADLREQLRFSEEEEQNMRKKCSRLEDENDSLAMQLKKMAMKARRRSSPSPGRLSTPEPSLPEKDEGISEDDDPAELRLQLELNEQEAAILRRKVEDLERASETNQNQIKELQEKLSAKLPLTATSKGVRSDLRPASSSAAVLEKKILVLEEESSELRKKLIEKERDYERLHAELTLAHKRSKTSARSRSLDSSEQALDLKRQLQVIEQEAAILRTKSQELESKNEKLAAENKKLSIRAAQGGTPPKESADLSAKVSELKEKLATVEKELSEANSKLKAIKPDVTRSAAALEVEKLKNQLVKVEMENERLKEGGARLRTRSPKKPTDMTTKLQMKKMVDELELEVSELCVGLSIAQKRSADAANKNVAASTKEMDDIKNECESLKEKLVKVTDSYDTEKSKSEENMKRMVEDVTKTKDEVLKLQAENRILKESLEKLKTTQESAKKTQAEKTKALSELEETKALASAFQRESEEKIKEEAKKNEAERVKLQKDIAEKTKKLVDAEKKAKDTEEKLKKTEKILGGKKDKLARAEKDLEAEKEKLKQIEITQKEVAVGWLRERDELKANVTEMSRKLDQLQEQLSGRVREVETLENSLASEQGRVAELLNSNESNQRATSAAVEKQLESAREELAVAKARASEISAQLDIVENAKKEADVKAKREISDLQKKLSDMESGRTFDVKKLELQVKEKEQEVRSLNIQLKSAQLDSGASGKKVLDLQEECSRKTKELEKELAEKKHAYEDLTIQYEQLETEHVVTKAQLTMDREKAEGTVDMAHNELATLKRELQALRETYNRKQDDWIKEKLKMQSVIRELEENLQRTGGDSMEIKRLKAILDEKATENEITKHELDVMNDQHSILKKEADDLRSKLEDYDRVGKIQRNMNADSAAQDKELKQLKAKISQEEKSHKAEVAQLKLRYDSRVALISEEMQTLQNQVSKFKKERDSQRHMLEAAQKTIGELRASGGGGKTTSIPYHLEPGEESEETQTKIASLEQSLACLEDELSDSKLEASKLKTELLSERSAWEVKISEMQSRLNEFEEDRLISTGRTKIPGMRTRIELAWQKEREEQHRLLQETSTLARDLRQTLFEVERERDKERLESKRKVDQIKKSMEEELEENRRKITEMQYDLLELRDAHAKIRTTNEKMRRERERHEKERDEIRQLANVRKRQDAEEERKVNALLEQIEELMRLTPDLFRSSKDATGSTLALPSAPKRVKGARSRESSPGTGARELSVGVEDRRQVLQTTLSRLTEATAELRKHKKSGEDDKDRERARRFFGLRRAASSETEPAPEDSKKSKLNGSGKKGGLFRKSLSLEQTGGTGQDQNIWKGEGGSTSSLEVGSELSLETRFLSLSRRETSLDRLSTDSTQSEILSNKKKNKGFLGKLKKLASSRSIDDGGESLGGSGSDISVDASVTDKKDKKGKLLGLFKRAPSRSSSVDKEAASLGGSTDSLQRPLRASSASRPLAPSTIPASTPAPAANRYVR